MLPNLDKHVLGKVVGVVVVYHHLAHVPVHLARIFAHELIEGQVAAGGVLKSEQDVVVFQTAKRCAWMAKVAVGGQNKPHVYWKPLKSRLPARSLEGKISPAFTGSR